MLKKQILEKLDQIKQPHLAVGLEDLSEQDMQQFLNQLSLNLFKEQQAVFHDRTSPAHFTLITDADVASDTWKPLGTQQLIQGKVGVLILAGGQGSRVASHLPKALIPIDGEKTLLEIHLTKMATASTTTCCAILTSHANHHQISQFLHEKKFCGLDQHQVDLVVQEDAPFLDDAGHWILQKPGKLAGGPDGNGHALHLLSSSGVLSKWKKKQIETITIVPIDNPLANPIDPILLGYHTASQKGDVTVKVIRLQTHESGMGIMVRKKGSVAVQEYSELPPNFSTQGCLAHIGLFALTLSFAEKLKAFKLPWHLAHKKDPSTGKLVWKFERFIFDMLPYSSNTRLLLYPREEVYAPLKNQTGDKSLETVRAALKK